MATVKEKQRVQFQWQEAPARPKLRRTWNSTIPKHPRDQEPSLRPSDKSKKPLLNKGSHFSEAFSEFSSNVALHPHQRRASWLLDARKPNLRPRNTLIEAVREDFVTGWSSSSSQQQERVLLAERYALLELGYSANLSDAQVARLRWLEAKLDQLDDQDPVEQEADRRLTQTSDKLDEILSLLRGLPRKSPKQSEVEEAD